MSLKDLILIWFSLKCEKAMGTKFYSWYWIICPNWRWYLLQFRPDLYKDKYKVSFNEVNRLRLWRINGYKYKLRIWKKK